MRAVRSVAALAGLSLFLGGTALAQVYKYKKPDGTVVYTDKLSELPPDKRAHYNRLEQEEAQRRKAQENQLGKEEYERRQVEAARAKLLAAQMEESERQRRMAEIEASLTRSRRRRESLRTQRSIWQNRIQKARKKVDEKLTAFREAQAEYSRLATSAGFALLPGQAKQKEDLREKLSALEREVDAAIREVYVVIPEEARRAGVPPGWLR